MPRDAERGADASIDWSAARSLLHIIASSVADLPSLSESVERVARVRTLAGQLNDPAAAELVRELHLAERKLRCNLEIAWAAMSTVSESAAALLELLGDAPVTGSHALRTLIAEAGGVTYGLPVTALSRIEPIGDPATSSIVLDGAYIPCAPLADLVRPKAALRAPSTCRSALVVRAGSTLAAAAVDAVHRVALVTVDPREPPPSPLIATCGRDASGAPVQILDPVALVAALLR